MELVIRDSGERSTALCIAYHERLFSRMRCRRHGSATLTNHENLDNLLAELVGRRGPFLILDPDVILLRTGPIFAQAEKVERQSHYLKFALRCRFLGQVFRGAHLFSSALIEQMYNAREQGTVGDGAPGFLERPLRVLVEHGLSALKIDPTHDADWREIGTHDFFQYRRHIFQKMAYRAWREPQGVASWQAVWEQGDEDERAAAAGLAWGARQNARHLRHKEADDAFMHLGITEKQPVIAEEEIRAMWRSIRPLGKWQWHSQRQLRRALI